MANLQDCKNFKVVGIGSLAAKQLPTLKAAGYRVEQLPAPANLDPSYSNETSVYLLDAKLGDITKSIGDLKTLSPTAPIVVISADKKAKEITDSLAAGAYWYLTGDFKGEELNYIIARACVLNELSNLPAVGRAQAPLPEVQAIVAKSAAMKETLSRAKVIAELDTTVLLTGESGTGKTTLARFIHQLSSVSSGPFIPVSCASIPRELLEAELFGHEKGSFTGAAASRPGLVELANKGTLFLDEVGDLPLDLQPKILTFLQDRSARRVGGRQQYSVDVRVIAATNRDLRQMCARQEFREDLFYRLNVISLEIPPLRSRRDDVPALISAVLDNIAKRRGAASYRLAAAALDSATKYNWPGNVRELENILERASAFAKNTTISEEELGLGRDAPQRGSSANLSGFTMAELETRAIRDTLETTGGDKAAAAKMLGISLKTIYNKINRYGI